MAVNGHTSRKLTVRQAAFIGVGAMVGAGIFSLLGAAGEVAGAGVWLSFLIAGAIALLQGYSFAKFGARYPSAAGLLEYVVRGLGNGHVTGIIAWLILAANAIVTGMVRSRSEAMPAPPSLTAAPRGSRSSRCCWCWP
jgi:amino acid transporter